jgi:hypothetical protein
MKIGDVFWAIWKYATLTALMLSLISYLGLAGLYMARLPRRPDPGQDRVVPVWIKGNSPLYGNHREDQLWEVSKQAFMASVFLFFITAATAEYRKEKERREARNGSMRTI